MAKFIFQFQRILNIKQQREHVLQLEIAHLDKEMLGVRSKIQRLTQLRQDAMQRLRRSRRDCDIAVNDQYAFYFQDLRRRMECRREDLSALADSKSQVREGLERAMQERKLLEQYRDRLQHQHDTQTERAEERMLDSYSIGKFIRREVAP